jgi:hypothetical protein
VRVNELLKRAELRTMCALAIDKDLSHCTAWDWNPIDNTEDVQEIKSKLQLKVEPPRHFGDGYTCGKYTVFRDNPDEQMRLAIVYAAADIGRLIEEANEKYD